MATCYPKALIRQIMELADQHSQIYEKMAAKNYQFVYFTSLMIGYKVVFSLFGRCAPVFCGWLGAQMIRIKQGTCSLQYS